MNYEPSPEERESLQEQLITAYKSLNYIDLERAKGNRDLDLFHQRDEVTELISKLEARLAGVTDKMSPAAENFSRATRAYLTGKLWEAIRYYELTLKHDPYFPRAKEMRFMAETEVGLRESAAKIPRYHDRSLTLLNYGNKLILAGVFLLLAMIVVLFLYFSWA